MVVNVKPTVDIIADLVAEFNAGNVGNVGDPQPVGDDNWQIDVCETGWIRNKSIIDIDGTDFVVTSFEDGVSFTVKNQPSVAAPFSYPKVNFFHDTLIGQNDQLTKIDDINDKFPMIWLFETFTETKPDTFDTSIDRIVPLRFFILDNSNYTDWFNDDHYKNAIVPMTNLAESFHQFLKNHKQIGEIDEHLLTSHKNFGTVDSKDGHVLNWFNEHSSGVEYRVTLPIDKELTCKNC